MPSSLCLGVALLAFLLQAFGIHPDVLRDVDDLTALGLAFITLSMLL